MRDKVYRVVYEFSGDELELYASQEEADKSCKKHQDGVGDNLKFEVVPYMLPEGAHLPTFPMFPHDLRDARVKKDGRPYLRLYRPGCVSGYPDEHYLFDTEEAFWEWVHNRWPDTPGWRVEKYGVHGKHYTLDGWSPKYSWWCAAFVDNVKIGES